MLRRFVGLAAGLVIAFAFVGPLTAAPIDTNEETEGQSEATDCSGMNNSLIAVHPSLLWPPNHKYYGDQENENLYFLADSGDATGTESINLTTTGTHDQYDGDAEFNGSGNTGDEDGDGIADDVTPNDDGGAINTDDSTATMPVYDEMNPMGGGSQTVQTDWMARAERAGTGIREGVPNRTYTLTGMAEFGDGGSCSLSIDITVPHDMGKGDGNGKKEPVR